MATAKLFGPAATTSVDLSCDIDTISRTAHCEYESQRLGRPTSLSSFLTSPRTEKCWSSCGRPIRRRYNKECRNYKKNTNNCYILAIFCLMVVDCPKLLPTLQFLDAFRMVRYSATRISPEAQFSNNNHCNTLFGTQHDQDNQQQKLASKDPFQATGQDDLFKTLAGGPALIFEMARKSMLFATKETDNKQPTNTTTTVTATPTPRTTTAVIATPTPTPPRTTPTMTTTTTRPVAPTEQARPPPPTQGRWYPHSGIANNNPNFRTQAPAMTNKGFAKSIWKNARKRNKPSLWKYALRTYDRMALLEGDPNFGQIKRSNIHHEGAMQACAKLGLWQRALEIYHYVYQQEMGEDRQSQRKSSPSSSILPQDQQKSKRQRNEKDEKGTSVYVTDDMVLSLVRSTVRASRLRSRQKRKSHDPPLSQDQEEQEAALRRIPLDTALEILSTLPEDHNIPLVAYYLNPLASAYQSLGYTAFSKEILETMLSNRTAGEDDIFNVHDLCAKDKGSYSLLVQASVATGDWGSAVDSLSEMTNAGIYPNSRHCNVWSEISERQTRPRAVGSWKKKRDDYWTDSVR